MKAIQITAEKQMAVVELEKPEVKSGEVLLQIDYGVLRQ